MKVCLQYLNSEATSFASWLKGDGKGAIKFAIFIYRFIWDKQKYRNNFEVVGMFIFITLENCALPYFTPLVLVYTDLSAIIAVLTWFWLTLVRNSLRSSSIHTRHWLRLRDLGCSSACFLFLPFFCLSVRSFFFFLFVYQYRQYWICRYLPDENRNMMISRNSVRSGVDYYLIIHIMIFYYLIFHLSSPILDL